jgi:hypothetical protein
MTLAALPYAEPQRDRIRLIEDSPFLPDCAVSLLRLAINVPRRQVAHLVRERVSDALCSTKYVLHVTHDSTIILLTFAIQNLDRQFDGSRLDTFATP